MKALLLVLVGVLFLLPQMVMAEGNPNPLLELIIRASSTDSLPTDACIFPAGVDPFDPLPCYAEKQAAGDYGFLSVHVGRALNGFLGLPFGIVAEGDPVTLLEFVPCFGFRVAASSSIPSAIVVRSSIGCRPSREAIGYFKYVSTSTWATYFNIVPNADFGHCKVINCDHTYDGNTCINGMAQWGGTQSIVCPYTYIATDPLTWGSIKSLFR